MNDRFKLAVLNLLAITLVKGFLYAAVVPAWQAPDEPAYFKEIVALAGGELKSFTGHPLLYAMASYLPYEVGGEGYGKILAVRLLSVFFTAISVFFVYKIAKYVLPNEQFVHIMAPAIATFIPQFTFIGASVNSDSMVAAIFSIMTYLSVIVIKEGLNLKRFAAIVCAGVAGFFTKERIIIAFPLIGIVLVYGLIVRYKDKWTAFWEGNLSIREAIFFISSLVAAVMLWPYMSNRISKISIDGFQFERMLEFRPIMDLNHAIPVGNRMFMHFWGYFGWLHIPLMPWFYSAYKVLSVLSAAGLALGLLSALKGFLKGENRASRKDAGSFAIQLSFLMLSVFASIYAVLAYNYLTRGARRGVIFF